MALLVHAIVLTCCETIELDSFDVEYPVHDHRDDLELGRHAAAMKKEIHVATSKLYITNSEEIK